MGSQNTPGTARVNSAVEPEFSDRSVLGKGPAQQALLIVASGSGNPSIQTIRDKFIKENYHVSVSDYARTHACGRVRVRVRVVRVRVHVHVRV